MYVKSLWNYANRGLLAILSILVVFSLASIIFLIHTLLQLNSFLNRSSSAVGSALVLQDLVINLQKIESGPRAYVATGQPEFLEDRSESEARIRHDLNIIKNRHELQIDDQRVQRIDTLARQKMEYMRQLVAVRDEQGPVAATEMLASLQGKTVMDQLQEEIDAVTTQRLNNIGPAQKRISDDARRAIAVAGAMAVFVLGTCVAVIWYFQRAILRERALDNTKSEFLSLASHQLRTPATNVKQYLGLLLDGYMGDLTDQQRRALEVANKNNEAEIQIMNNLLDVAKLDLHKIQLDRKPTDIVKIARQVITELQPKAAERGQTINLTGEKELIGTVDAGYVKGVIENLVDNAMKYSKEGTDITVKVTRDDGLAVISVRDQGLGIRKRDFGKLFNKFSRLDNEFSANSQGSGLGLYWVKHIVSLHGGRIWMSSKEGKGSVFKIQLPIK